MFGLFLGCNTIICSTVKRDKQGTKNLQIPASFVIVSKAVLKKRTMGYVNLEFYCRLAKNNKNIKAFLNEVFSESAQQNSIRSKLID